MRIALDATYSIDPNPSGIAVYSRKILNGLAEAHPTDEFVHCYRSKQLRAAPTPAFLNVRRRLLLPPLPTFGADVFHALNQRVDRRPAKRVISTFHDLFVLTSEYSTRDFRERFADQARRAAANSDLIITVSEFTASQVHELLKVPRDRIRAIAHGVDRPPAGIDTPKQKLVLFVGALQIRKNVLRLVEAFEKMPPDWKLVLVGAKGFGAGEILRKIEVSAAKDRIRAPGYVTDNDLNSLYARASIFAFPSLDEGFGMPVLEAMARGIPVITSNRSALREVADDAALLVDPYRTTEITECLCELSDNPALQERLRQAGLERARQFTWEKAVEATYAAYRELMN